MHMGLLDVHIATVVYNVTQCYYWAVWWASGLVTWHSELWSWVRIPVAVGEICNHN